MRTISFISLQDSLPLLSYGYLAAYYRKYSKHGADVDFKTIDCSSSFNYKSERHINRMVKKLSGSELVAFTTVTQDYSKILTLSKAIKNELKIPIIYGGHHISALPETLPEFVDLAVVGEGEQTFLEVIDSYIEKKVFDPSELSKIDGIAFHVSGDVYITKKRALIKNLDSIPNPDRSIFDKKYFNTKIGWSENIDLTGKVIANMSISRGCPYNCIFCSSSKQWSNTIRFFSHEHVVSEIEELVNRYNVQVILIADDLISIDAERLEIIYSQLEEKGLIEKIEFGAIQIRADLISDRLCKILKKLKVKTLCMGIESGSQKTLNFLKGGDITVEKNFYAISLAHSWGFNVWPQLIVGVPGEKKEDIEKTLKFCFLDGVEYFQITLLTPLPGTVLWDYALKRKVVDNNMEWEGLSLNLNRHNLMSRVYLGDVLTREETWKMIEEPLAMIQRKKAFNFKIELRKNSARYLESIARDPVKYLRFIFHIIFMKIFNKMFIWLTKLNGEKNE